jgi:hypothetical protein
MVGFAFWWRHKRTAKKQAASPAAGDAPKAQLSYDSPQSSLTVAAYSNSDGDDADVEKGQRVRHSTPCNKREGWVVANSVTSPAFKAAVDSNIQFGECRPDVI